MRFLLSTLVGLMVLTTNTTALYIKRRDWLEPSAVAQDWDDGTCKPLGVIFARGTFDSGNIGTWVGPQFLTPLQNAGAAIQGVHQDIYPATLESYLSIGTAGIGNAGSIELAAQVTKYLDTCPNSTVVISGWSQGALVARQGYLLLDSTHQSHISAVATFGDPITRFANLQQDLDTTSPPSPPPQLPHEISCNTDPTTLDPLCISLDEALSLLNSSGPPNIPFTPATILGPWLNTASLSTGVQQAVSTLKLAVLFLPQLRAALPLFLDDLSMLSTAARLLLWPTHFLYGDDGRAARAAEWVLALPAARDIL